MLRFEDALKKYPERLRGFKENILKEYLQYKILDIIYSSKYAERMIFIGGTAIRIVHEGVRFSEDIDFDNRGLAEEDFDDVANIIQRNLSIEGYSVEVKNVFKGAYHCYIRFPGLLFDHNISGHKEERILIQIDAESQNYQYLEDKFLINKFGIFRYINTVPAALLLAQKIFACLKRKRAKGRDFFDVVFLMSLADPDYNYLRQKAGIESRKELISALQSRIQDLNMRALALDVEPFLFDSTQKDRIILFEDWLKTLAAED